MQAESWPIRANEAFSPPRGRFTSPAMLASCGAVAEARREREKTEKNTINIQQHSGIGLIWFAGWMFTIGYLGLNFWTGLFALFIWPYFLGVHYMPAAG